MIIWKSEVKTCQVGEFSCPTDVNVPNTVSVKENTYEPLLHGMQLLYPDNKYELNYFHHCSGTGFNINLPTAGY